MTLDESPELKVLHSENPLRVLSGNAKIEPSPIETDYDSKERFRISKNVIMIGLAFMVHFTAFHGTSNLQSSINADAALGTTTLAVIYGSLILSNIFLPMTVIRWFGVRLTMALAFCTYMPYIVAQFYPRFSTLIPAGLMVGFGGGPLWCAKCTYLSTMAEALTRVNGQNSSKDVNTVKYFSLFFIFYQMAQVWGNLISSSVLSMDIKTNDLNNTDEMIVDFCGAHFCPDIDTAVNSNLTPPDPLKIQLLNSIFLTCMVLAAIFILCGVDSLKRYGKKRRSYDDPTTEASGLKLLATTLSLLKKRRQLLMLPITMFIGLEQSFLAVDFTKSFVACGWGISNIGFAMICFGVANAIAAGFAGTLVAKFGRYTLTVMCALCHMSLLGYMLFYRPQPGHYLMYCVFAAVWGFCDGLWLVIINAFYGILFPNELIAAYSNFRLWESTGSVIGYSISSQLCTSIKLIILIIVLIFSCFCYAIIEIHLRRKKNATNQSNLTSL